MYRHIDLFLKYVISYMIHVFFARCYKSNYKVVVNYIIDLYGIFNQRKRKIFICLSLFSADAISYVEALSR